MRLILRTFMLMAIGSVLLCLVLVCTIMLGHLSAEGLGLLMSKGRSVSDGVAIPQLHDLSVSHPEVDWQQQGLALTVFAGDAPQVKPYTQFGVTARIGWNAVGLLAQVRVVDSTPVEAAADDRLYEGDSVELLLKNPNADTGMIQLVASPGRDPAHPQLRQTFYDYRSNRLRQRLRPIGQASCRQTSNGYIATLLLPWKNLELQPQQGLTLGARINVNDAAKGQTLTRLTWVSPNRTYDFWDLPIVHLAKQASGAPQAVAWAGYDALTTVRVNLLADRALAATQVQVLEDDQVRATGKLQPDGDRALLRLAFPAPPVGQTNAPLHVVLGGQPMTDLILPDLEQERQALFHEAAFSSDANTPQWAVPRFQSEVFAGETFPSFGYLNPSLVRQAIGDFVIKQIFYNAQRVPVTQAIHPGRYGAVTRITRSNGDAITLYNTLFRLASDTAAKMSDDPVVLAARWAANPEAGAIDPQKQDRDWWHQLRKQLGTAIQYEYFVRLPPGYDTDRTKHYPIIYYLHGSGGGDAQVWNRVKENEGPQYLARTETNFPFIVVSLRSPGGWDPPAVKDVMDAVESQYRVDPTRRYLTGFSMGGMGTWNVAYDQPQRFAAIAPVGGLGGDLSQASRLKPLAIWVFNGADDTVTLPKEVQRAVKALQAVGVAVRYTEIPHADHVKSLEIAYRNPALYAWFLAHQRDCNVMTNDRCRKN